MSARDNYEAVIGLEVHCQLSTHTKIFSGAPTAYGAEPNTQVAPVDLGLPGVLPVLNRDAVALALRAGLALDCDINMVSRFARKNYFYPDLPKGYQISQHTLPLCEHGHLDIEVGDGDDVQSKRVGITRIHMEEDAGKSTHVGSASLVDLNRAGVPLIEIVSEPDLRSADEAVAYLKELRTIVRYLDVCDGNMEEGSFRCDANVSVRPKGQTELGTRCELKNINSFKFIKDAIEYEIRRQVDLIEAGEQIVQQTRLYNPDRGQTYPMRSKEESRDYRYFPDPDLPPLIVTKEWLEQTQGDMPELPGARRERYVSGYGLSAYDAGVLCAEREIAEYFEGALEAYGDNPKGVANWVINEVLRFVDSNDLPHTKATPANVGELVRLIDTDVISGKIGKQVFETMVEEGGQPEAIVEAKGLKQITDDSAIGAIVDEIMADNPDQVEAYRGGKDALIGWFVGQVMRATRGKANPQVVNQVLRDKLDG
jgi:aspartyl-tRNA(Asn)/glutamyl-tRNA(Gln) amidotransferase subunit B